ncbi:hypothetical protein ACVW1C_000162 [Bradyrhizobium sp. USDA 4011]
MKILGLDIATTTGIALLDGDRYVFARAFHWEGKNSGQVFRHFRKTLYQIIKDNAVKYVAAEEPLRTDIELKGKPTEENPEPESTRPPMKTFLRIYGLCAIAQETCAAHDVPFIYVNQGTWRKAFTGSGRATKDTSLGFAQLIDKTITSYDAAESLGVAWWLRGHLDPRFAAPRGDLFEPTLTPSRKETPF